MAIEIDASYARNRAISKLESLYKKECEDACKEISDQIKQVCLKGMFKTWYFFPVNLRFDDKFRSLLVALLADKGYTVTESPEQSNCVISWLVS